MRLMPSQVGIRFFRPLEIIFVVTIFVCETEGTFHMQSNAGVGNILFYLDREGLILVQI